jgi:hypothetical protein
MFELWSSLEDARQEMEESRVSALVPELWSDVKFQGAKVWGSSYAAQSEFRITEKDVWTEAQDVWIIGAYMRLEQRGKTKSFDIPSQSWPCL